MTRPPFGSRLVGIAPGRGRAAPADGADPPPAHRAAPWSPDRYLRLAHRANRALPSPRVGWDPFPPPARAPEPPDLAGRGANERSPTSPESRCLAGLPSMLERVPFLRLRSCPWPGRGPPGQAAPADGPAPP